MSERDTVARYGTPLTPAELRVIEWRLPDIDLDAFHVYVVWSAIDPSECLYVGRSEKVILRIGTHTRSSSWSRDIGLIQLYEYATAAEMEAAEIRLIHELRPTRNGMVPEILEGVFMSWKPAR